MINKIAKNQSHLSQLECDAVGHVIFNLFFCGKLKTEVKTMSFVNGHFELEH
jgi:hypothetical protein